MANEAARKTIKTKIMMMIWRKYKASEAHNFSMFECGRVCICVFLYVFVYVSVCIAIKDNLCVEMNGMEAQQKKKNRQTEY